jgi:hypothetical protein
MDGLKHPKRRFHSEWKMEKKLQIPLKKWKSVLSFDIFDLFGKINGKELIVTFKIVPGKITKATQW